jgi:hypothetical protein
LQPVAVRPEDSQPGRRTVELLPLSRWVLAPELVDLMTMVHQR